MARTDVVVTATAQFVADDRFASMGNTAHVVVVAHDEPTATALLEKAHHCAATLETTWSRFIPTSDVSRLNTARGRLMRISPDTEVLIRHLLAAHEATDGLFDPFVLPALIAAGYSTSLAGDGRISCAATAPIVRPSASSAYLETVDGETWCRLLDGATLDPGGLGKGLAADIIASELLAAGATGVLVNLGGDARAAGTCQGEPWQIGIRDDRSTSSPIVAEFDMGDQGVATSSSLRRRWQGRHHLIDPNTGAPTASDVLQATVFAPTAWQAEAMATVALVRGREVFEAWAGSCRYSAFLFGAEGEPIILSNNAPQTNSPNSNSQIGNAQSKKESINA